MTFNLHQIKSFTSHLLTARRRAHGVHSPFAYALCENVFYNHNSYYCFGPLEKLRQQLMNSKRELPFTELGAGSKVLSGSHRKVSDIATRGISSKQQCELLYRLVNFLNCSNCLELGTSLGLTTLYLASVNASTKVVSIEGSPALAAFARELAAEQKRNNVQIMDEPFETGLPKALNALGKLDFFYVDGNHTREATLSYFNQALPYRHNASVFVFDDIYWSADMTQAWNEIKAHPSVSMSIDLFYMGLVFFRDEVKEPVALKLYI